MQFPEATASSPTEGVRGDQETAVTGEEEASGEISKTWRKMGRIRVCSEERGEGK